MEYINSLCGKNAELVHFNLVVYIATTRLSRREYKNETITQATNSKFLNSMEEEKRHRIRNQIFKKVVI
jgi:hypothetical protein